MSGDRDRTPAPPAVGQADSSAADDAAALMAAGGALADMDEPAWSAGEDAVPPAQPPTEAEDAGRLAIQAVDGGEDAACGAAPDTATGETASRAADEAVGAGD